MSDNKEMILVEKSKYNKLQEEHKQCKTCEFRAKIKKHTNYEKLQQANARMETKNNTLTAKLNQELDKRNEVIDRWNKWIDKYEQKEKEAEIYYKALASINNFLSYALPTNSGNHCRQTANEALHSGLALRKKINEVENVK